MMFGGKKDKVPKAGSSSEDLKKRSSKHGWLWLILFFGGLWGAGYVLYQYEPGEILDLLRTPLKWAEDELQNLKTPQKTESEKLSAPPAQAEKPKPEVVQEVVKALPPPPDELTLGVDALGKGELELAEMHLRQAVSKEPNRSEPYLFLGLLAYKKGIYLEALNNYKQALVYKPAEVRALKGRSVCLFRLAEAAKADNDLEKAYGYLKEADPQYIDPLNWTRMWSAVAPKVEARRTVALYLDVLEKYQHGNQLFIQAWSLELPSPESLKLFTESESAFKGSQAQLEKGGTGLAPELGEPASAAIQARLRSLEICKTLAQTITNESAAQLEQQANYLKEANTAVRNAVSAFSDFLNYKEDLYSNEELEKIRLALRESTKGILVSQKEGVIETRKKTQTAAVKT